MGEKAEIAAAKIPKILKIRKILIPWPPYP